MTALLDGNVLVALTAPKHVHHEAAHRWWAGQPSPRFATCPITQGTLLRLAMRFGSDITTAVAILRELTAHPAHEFWVDDVGYLDVELAQVHGHRQVTDAYLAGLARRNKGSLATFDRALAAAHPDVATLVPSDN